MRYCPYCGTCIEDDAYSFCLGCGKPIPTRQEPPHSTKKEGKQKQVKKTKMNKKHAVKEKAPENSAERVPNLEEDGYDGYYDDIKTIDLGRVRQGIDKEMIKRIAGLIIGVLIVICACVAIMYLL